MPTRREALLGDVIATVAEHGIGSRSLRDLGELVGTSHRMLIHHLGSREGLLLAIVETMEAGHRALLTHGLIGPPCIDASQPIDRERTSRADCDPVTANPVDPAKHALRRQELLSVVMERGLIQFEEPRELASGELSCDFIDAKYALSRGRDLGLACQVIADSIALMGIEYTAVGGLTLGADQFSHGIAAYLADDREWFVVRKQAKGRGTNQRVEGARLSEASRVLLVDDIVTTGGSIQQAFAQVVETGAVVVAAVTLVDRGEVAKAYFAEQGVPYRPVFTYHDLGIKPVSDGTSLAATSTG